MSTLDMNFTGNKASKLIALFFIALPLLGYRIWRRQIQRKKTNMQRKWDAKHHGGGLQSGRKAWICSSKQGNTREPRLFYNFSWM